MTDTIKLFIPSDEESATFFQDHPDGKYEFTVPKSGHYSINNRSPKYFEHGQIIEMWFNPIRWPENRNLSSNLRGG